MHANTIKVQSALSILLVEEDTAVREVLATLLVHHGLLVRSASNGSQAIALYRKHAQSIGMVLLDVGMKNLDGPQTLSQLRRINPGVACCFMTGGSEKYDAAHLMTMGAACVFLKPFHVSEVVKKLTQLAPDLILDASLSIDVANPDG